MMQEDLATAGMDRLAANLRNRELRQQAMADAGSGYDASRMFHIPTYVHGSPPTNASGLRFERSPGGEE